MISLYLLEPDASAAWFPFADCRPVAELRAGAWLIRERWEAVAKTETNGIFGPEHLYGFAEEGVPPVQAVEPVEDPTVSGDQSGRVLDVGVALDHRLDQVSDLSDAPGGKPQDDRVPDTKILCERVFRQYRPGRRKHQPADRSFDRFLCGHSGQ
jgi:hypothetical protein